MGYTSYKGNAGQSYLEVSVDDLQRVQVGHSLQHLPDHVAGVSLRVVALVQDPVKHLSACGAAEEKPTCLQCFFGFFLLFLSICKEKEKTVLHSDIQPEKEASKNLS